MTTLHIDLEAQPGREGDLLRAFDQTFAPAVSTRDGFRRVAFLQPIDDRAQFRISLEFETEELRQAWVASDAHLAAWASIEACCAHYATALFDDEH